jgi:mannose-6-phosphate isomerase-like protein (cupin superfamily)
MIVTPKKAATSSLNVTLLTLHPGREIPSTVSVGVEFYYVISGSGSFSQQGIHARGNVGVGDAFVVQPGRMRWISNAAGTEDFILLRASDDARQQYASRVLSSTNTPDQIRMDPSRVSNLSVRLREGIRRVHSMAKDCYVRSRSTEWKTSES